MKQESLNSEISALKAEHEKVVEQLEKRYMTIVNVLFPNFIFVFDEEFMFTDIITPEGLKLFHDNHELIGTSARNIYSPEVCELFIANIHECLEKKHLKEIEYHLDLFGTRYFYQARLMPIADRQVMCLIQDIGDRVRRMEELLAQRKRAEEADKMKSAFLANMSHEIRTPLNAIIGFSEFLAKENDAEKREYYMSVIRNSNNLLLQVVNDILDLSRIESGKSEIKFEDTDIITLMQEVGNIHQLRMKKDLELILDLPEKEIRALTDANRVKQILFNLLSNATKNTEKGFVSLKVETAKDGDNLLFSVVDTGRGISPDKIEVIFNRFEKLDNFNQGAGLGLAISKELVECLGGKIWVESEVGTGSSFFFTIPYRNAPQQIGSVKTLIANRKKKILVMIESEPDFLFIQNILQKNYDLVWATNGEKAINSFILDQPAIVLLDVKMTLLKGDDALKKMRAISTSLPVIAIVADDFYHEQRWAIENGCNDVLSKPFSPSKIEELVLAFT